MGLSPLLEREIKTKGNHGKSGERIGRGFGAFGFGSFRCL